MAFTGMTRLQIRRRVQALMRDDGYPVEAINEALERVIAHVNNSGRYRWQESTLDLTLVTNTYTYNMTTLGSTTFLGDIDVIYNPQSGAPGVPSGNTGSWGLHKMAFDEALEEGRFSTLSTGEPEIYCLPGAGETLWIDPLPNSTANGKTLRVFGYSDLTPPTGDLTAITGLPARYHSTLLVYGVLAEVAPALQVNSADGYISASKAYTMAFEDFRLQEKWQPHMPVRLRRDNRWDNISRISSTPGRIV
jgi:hypothetical protein